jgi:hypothetical protein
MDEDRRPQDQLVVAFISAAAVVPPQSKLKGSLVMNSQINLRSAELATAPNLAESRWDLSKRENWDTPRILMGMAAAVCVASIWLFIAITGATSESKNAVKSIGKDCAPSIVAAQKIAVSLADFDCNIINQLICEPGSKDMKMAEDTARQRHTEITNGLVNAAENITFGDNERVPIQRMTDGLGKYETTMEEAKILLQTKHAAEAIKTARTATDLMHGVLLPAADQLDKANRTVLDKAYKTHQTERTIKVTLLLLASMVLLGALGGAQYYTFRKMNRVLNPGLAAATVLTVFLTGYTLSILGATNEILRSAVKDAFDSVHFLWHARAVAYDSNGEETRWLFDREKAAQYAETFFAKSKSLAAYQGLTMADLPDYMNCRKLAAMTYSKDSLSSEFKGFLADEMRNITFQGEREAATSALVSYGEYLKVDKAIRKLEEEGQHAEAIRLCVSNTPGGSNYTFGNFDDALGETLKINQKAFDDDIVAGFQKLGRLSYMPAVTILLIVASAIFGLWQRIKEYHV